MNGRYVWIEASKDGAKWHSYVPIREGKFDGAAHLGGGPGLYWAKVMVQTKVGANWYKTVAEVPVINTNSKTVLQPSVIQPEGQEAGLRLDPVTAEVPDGLLSLSGQVDPKRNIKSLWLKAKLGNQQDDIHLPVTEGRFNGKVPLALGAGDYEIAVLIPGGGSTWVVVGSLHVANQGTQVVRGFHYTAQAIARKVELTSPQTDPVEAQSRLTVAGTVGTSLGDFPYLIAETRFKGLEARYRLPVKMGRFEDDIRLRFGSGTYTVVLYAQVANTQLVEIVRFTVTTRTAQDQRELLPSLGIESENPEITALAKELTAGKPTLDAGRAIFEWTARNVRYDRSKAFAWHIDPDEGALRTLRTRTGVCRDYAALAVAMLRAAGIPSHVVVGKAGSGFDTAGHAWVEFLDGQRWVEMDPTFAAGVVTGTEFLPRYDGRYFDPAPTLLNATHVREGIQY